MFVVERSLRFIRGFFLSYGPTAIKKRVWDKEFAGGKWNFIDDTTGDCVYTYLEKYANGGNILDLGCGPGNTANELRSTAYRSYVGVDISEAALAKGRLRSQKCGRGDKNQFVQSDFLGYQPTQKFDVILFRESMYHVPMGKIKPLLEKYSQHLKDTGVFIVRMYTSRNGEARPRPNKMIDLIASAYDVLGRHNHQSGPAGATVLVFQPKKMACTPVGQLSKNASAG